MAKDIFKRVAKSYPIDRTAGVVTSGSFEHYEPTPAADCNLWFTECPEIFPIPPNQPQFVNLSGHKFGRVRVVGYAGSKKGKGSRWVCMCWCGRYTIQNGGALKSSMKEGKTNPISCEVCENVRAMRDFGKDSKFYVSNNKAPAR